MLLGASEIENRVVPPKLFGPLCKTGTAAFLFHRKFIRSLLCSKRPYRQDSFVCRWSYGCSRAAVPKIK